MRWLHLGCGSHHLPFPWENYDKEIDIKERLPFKSHKDTTEEVQFIFAEHVIEHIPFRDGLFFLSECHRILMPGGVLRLSFPDITRIQNQDVTLYADYLRKETGKQISSIEEVIWLMATGWGHQSVWSYAVATRLLLSLKFLSFQQAYGVSKHSELTGIDGRHRSEGLELARAETTIIEATKL